jgi:GNAT superfamily N-acetyltransferase
MAATEPLTTRPLGPDDAAAAFALSTEAGWNQTVADWQFMLDAGEAQGQVTAEGDLVASALILPYGGRSAWNGMVLTTKAHRRRGLATENLRWAIARCAKRGLIAGLDATPAGREVYAPLGFADGFGLERLTARQPDLPEPAGPVLRPMRAEDLPAATALDAKAFGAERRALLEYLLARQPGCAWVAETDGALAGFVLGRTGRATRHLGPLIARDAEIATALVARALADGSAVSIDVPDGQGAFRARLLAAGFAPVRPFTRMLRHDLAALPAPTTTFAIAGPELG